MLPGARTETTEILFHWFRYLESFCIPNQAIYLPENSNDPDLNTNISNTLNTIHQKSTETYPDALLGWVAFYNHDSAFARTAIGAPYTNYATTAANLGELLYLLDKKIPTNIKKIYIPIALDCQGSLFLDQKHWVLGLYEPQINKITILDSKSGFFDFHPLTSYTIQAILNWLIKHPFEYTNLNPFTKKIEINYIRYQLQGAFNFTDCGQFMIACAKKLISLNGNIEALIEQKQDIYELVSHPYMSEFSSDFKKSAPIPITPQREKDWNDTKDSSPIEDFFYGNSYFIKKYAPITGA